MLLLILCLLASLKAFRSGRWRDFGAAGLAWGAVMWISPNFLPVLLVLAALYIEPLRLKAITLPLLAILCASPWIARGYLRLGGFCWMRDGLWMELRLAYSDDAKATFGDNLASGTYSVHPFSSYEECRHLKEIGEMAFMTEDRREVMTWMASHPLETFGRTARHVWDFWVPRFTFRGPCMGRSRGFSRLPVCSLPGRRTTRWPGSSLQVCWPTRFCIILFPPT